VGSICIPLPGGNHSYLRITVEKGPLPDGFPLKDFVVEGMPVAVPGKADDQLVIQTSENGVQADNKTTDASAGVKVCGGEGFCSAIASALNRAATYNRSTSTYGLTSGPNCHSTTYSILNAIGMNFVASLLTNYFLGHQSGWGVLLPGF